jgi:uncharacterized delta-60 repeat protein
MPHGATSRTIRRLVCTIAATATVLTAVPGAAQAAPGDVLPGSQYTVWDAQTPQPHAMALAPDGSVYWATAPHHGGPGKFLLGQSTAAGPGAPPDADGHFGQLVTWDATQGFVPAGVGVQPDGKIVVAGVALDSAGKQLGIGVVRVNPDASLDPTFDGDGKVFLPNPAGATAPLLHVGNVVIGSTGRILFAVTENSASSGALTVRAFTAAGKPDKTFGTQGRAVALTSYRVSANYPKLSLVGNGKLVVGASQCETTGFWQTGNCGVAILRLTGSGAPDATFSGDGRVDVPSLVDDLNFLGVQVHALPGGNLLMSAETGNYVWENGVKKATLVELMARFLPDGSPDPSFGGGDGVHMRPGAGPIVDTAVQPDGKLLMLSFFDYPYEPGGQYPNLRPILRRFNWNGTRDLTFGTTPPGENVNQYGTPLGPVVDVDYRTYPTPEWEYSMLMNADGTLTLAGLTRGETMGGFTMLRMAL